MRIIAGEFKGRPLKAPKGEMTRPTTDRVREALMSTIISLRGGDLRDCSVLDAFAGSGALGLESLSRGAKEVMFYEKAASAMIVLKSNLASLKISASDYALFQADIFKHPPRNMTKAFDLIFLDPPYHTEAHAVVELLEDLRASNAIDANTLISYEHAKNADTKVDDALAGSTWKIVSHKSYGDSSIDIMRRESIDLGGKMQSTKTEG